MPAEQAIAGRTTSNAGRTSDCRQINDCQQKAREEREKFVQCFTGA